MTQTTIKEHLAAIEAHMTTSAAEECREHFTAIEAEIDSPMKSAEDWACYYLGLDTAPSNKWMGFQTMVSFVQRVQFDAIASKNIDPRPKPPLTKEHASWVADKLHALGDYAREAAWMLNNWPDATASKQPEVDLLKLAEDTARSCFNLSALRLMADIIHAALLKARGEK